MGALDPAKDSETNGVSFQSTLATTLPTSIVLEVGEGVETLADDEERVD